MKDRQCTDPPWWFRFAWLLATVLFIVLVVADSARAEHKKPDTCVHPGEVDFGPQQPCPTSDEPEQTDEEEKSDADE